METKFSFRAALRSIGRYLTAGILLAAAVGALSLFVKDKWVSEGRILPKRSKGGSLGSMAATAATLGLQLPSQDDSTDLYYDVITSRWMAERILAAPLVYNRRSWRYGPWAESRGNLLQYLKVNNPDKGMKALQGMLAARRDMRTGLLTVTCETDSPQLSQRIVQLALENLDQFFSSNYRTQGEAKAMFLKERMVGAQQEVAEAESSLKAFLNNNRNDRTTSDPLVRIRASSLESGLQLKRQVMASLIVAMESALTEAGDDRPVLTILDHANVPYEKSAPSRKNMVLLAFCAGVIMLLVADYRLNILTFFNNELKSLGYLRSENKLNPTSMS